MRGDCEEQGWMLLAFTPDQKVPQDHPIRAIKPIVERALRSLSPTFNRMYSKIGRPSIPPEHLLKASLLIALYSIRSERQFCERLEYDLLFKWFLDQNIATPAFDASTFSKNRQRLLEHDVARLFFEAVLDEARQRDLLSDDRFTVDGTLLEAWASLKSVRPRGDQDGPPSGGFKNPDVDYRGERRTNETHASTTDPEALLARKGRGKEARLSYAGHVLMENRNGLIVDIELTQATGKAEREAALRMLDRLQRKRHRRITLGADRGYDTQEFVRELRKRKVTPHVAQNQSGRRSAIDGRTTSHGGYKVSQRIRKRVEEIFGWEKTVAGGDKLRYIGVACNRLWSELTATGYNLVRIIRIERQQAAAAT
jgi:transposase/IS5 family transposase